MHTFTTSKTIQQLDHDRQHDTSPYSPTNDKYISPLNYIQICVVSCVDITAENIEFGENLAGT